MIEETKDGPKSRSNMRGSNKKYQSPPRIDPNNNNPVAGGSNNLGLESPFGIRKIDYETRLEL